MFNTVILLIVAFPLFAAAANGINLVAGERLWGWRQVQRLTCLMLFASFIGAAWVFYKIILDPTPREVIAYRWMSMGRLTVDVGFLKTPAGKGFAFVGPLFTDPSYFGSGAGIALRKGDTALRDKLNAAIKAIRANGVYKTIEARYFDFDLYGK